MSANEWINVTRICSCCGAEVTIRVRKKDYDEYYTSKRRRHVQQIFPYLTGADREMFISSTCPVCWDDMFSLEEE